jgi:RHS repeat-associated protein
VIGLVSQSKTLTGTYEYDRLGHSESWQVWENLPSGVTNRARYKGALWMGDLGVELYHMRNRWYEPRTGRFLSEDPIGLAGGINPYGFAGADPVNKADPTGLAYRCRGDGTAYLLVTNGQVWGAWISWGSWGCHNYETGDDSNEGVRDMRGGGSRGPGGPGPGSNQKVCGGRARVLQGNPSLIGRQGGFPGVRVTAASAAIIPDQFGVSKSTLAPFIGGISGFTNGQPLFGRVADVIGGRSPIPGQNVRDALQSLYPGVFIVEVVDIPRDLGVVPIELHVPADVQCPTGTVERP